MGYGMKKESLLAGFKIPTSNNRRKINKQGESKNYETKTIKTQSYRGHKSLGEVTFSMMEALVKKPRNHKKD